MTTTKLLDRWWNSLSKDVEEVRIEINSLVTKEVVVWLRIFLMTFGIPFVALLSILQPIYVADKLVSVWIGFLLFIGGIILGILLMEKGIDRIFREKAEKNLGEKQNKCLSLCNSNI